MVAIRELIDNPLVISKNIVIKLNDNQSDGLDLYIHDDCKEGIQNLNKEDEKNPFYFGYEDNERHTDNRYTSKNGVGMKKGMTKLSEYSTLFTQNPDPTGCGSNTYIKVTLDTKRMCAEHEPNQSYNPIIEEISETEYKKNHLSEFKNGTTIKLNDLLDVLPTTKEHFIVSLKEQIEDTYGRFTDTKISLYYNDNLIHLINPYAFMNDETCKKRSCYTSMYIVVDPNKSNAVVAIYLKMERNIAGATIKTNTLCYKVNTKNLGCNLCKELHSIKNSALDDIIQDYIDDGKKVLLGNIMSGSTLDTPHNQITKKNIISIHRNGRKHGMFEGDIMKDGYGTNIYHIFNFCDKELMDGPLKITDDKQIRESNMDPIIKKAFMLIKRKSLSNTFFGKDKNGLVILQPKSNPIINSGGGGGGTVDAKWTVTSLKKECIKRDMHGFSALRKSDIIKLLNGTSGGGDGGGGGGGVEESKDNGDSAPASAPPPPIPTPESEGVGEQGDVNSSNDMLNMNLGKIPILNTGGGAAATTIQNVSPSNTIINRIQGPGLRYKMKKKDVIDTLLGKNSNGIKLNKVPLLHLKVLLISMIYGHDVNYESTFGGHDSATTWKIYLWHTLEQLRDIYFDIIKDKKYDFEVIGGSVLCKYLMNLPS
jgi:hypothetical protein